MNRISAFRILIRAGQAMGLEAKETATRRASAGAARWASSVSLLLLALLLTLPVWAQEVSKDPDRVSPTQEDVPAPTPITPALPSVFQAGRNLSNLGALPPDQIAAVEQEAVNNFGDVGPRPQRMGVVRLTGREPLSLRNGSGERLPLGNGESVWIMAIQSPGAFSVRVHFSKFNVGRGSALVYGYDATGVITRGPYSETGPDDSGEFWALSVPGDTAFIEISGSENPEVEIDRIAHLDKDPAGGIAHEGEPGTPGSCELDVMCYGNPPVNPYGRDAVGRMFFQDGGGYFVCTGTILNDLDNETTVPYFLTAFHCINNQPAANSLEVVYGWQRASCGGALPNFYTLPRSNGGQLLVTNPTLTGNDMAFIRLRGDLPGGVALAGWTTAGLPAQTVGIHHPGGGWKRVVFGHANSGGPHCGVLPDARYHYVRQDSGITEGGSSGSAIFDGGGRVLGQLFGSCHYNPPNPCFQRDQWNDVYGKFGVTYPLIRRWLEIGGTINVNRFYGGAESGTPAQPYRTVTAANSLINSTAWDGARIKVQAASYPGAVTFTRKVTLIANGGAVTIGQ